MAITRVKSGIPGLDKLTEGGFPKNSIVLISGAPGTGKSILCMQYIYSGAKAGEPGIYVTFEQSEKDLISNGKKVGIDFAPLIKQGKMKVMHINLGTFEQSMLDVEDLMDTIKGEVKAMKAKRLVIDSLSSLINTFTLGYLGRKSESDTVEIGNTKLIPLVIDEKPISRTIVWNAINDLKGTGCTACVTSELSSESKWLSRDTVSEFAVDGILKVEAEAVGKKLQRNIVLVKMRSTKIDGGRHSMDITSKGIKMLD